MSKHIDQVKRAIEFGSPGYIPMELVDIPHIYNAYETQDPGCIKIPAGAESFDSAWCTYHWTFEYLGKTDAGEPIRKDEWGCTQIVPNDQNVAYIIIDRPKLSSTEQVQAHPWPDPEQANWFFHSRSKIIEKYYSDRFICGFIDPGPLLVAFNLLGYDGLLLNLVDNLELVKTVVRKITDYQIALVPKFKAMGAHMINLIDEVAGTKGMMFSPDIWREHFKPMYDDLFEAIHNNDMYSSCLLDGNIIEIMPDLMTMQLDQLLFAQPRATGIDVIADFCRGKRCVKMAVDMMETLASGTTQQITCEVDQIVNRLNTDKGGLVFQALRWHRPQYDPVRVKAQIEAMNRYRQGA